MSDAKTYYIQWLEKRTSAFLSCADMKEAAKAAQRSLPSDAVLLGVYERDPRPPATTEKKTA